MKKALAAWMIRRSLKGKLLPLAELERKHTRPLVNFKHMTDPEETTGTIAVEKWSTCLLSNC